MLMSALFSTRLPAFTCFCLYGNYFGFSRVHLEVEGTVGVRGTTPNAVFNVTNSIVDILCFYEICHNVYWWMFRN